MLKTEDQQKIDDEKALSELKEIPSVGALIFIRQVVSVRFLERFLYLCCRSFRSAQRRFKRRIVVFRTRVRESDNENPLIQRRYVSQNEFIEASLR